MHHETAALMQGRRTEGVGSGDAQAPWAQTTGVARRGLSAKGVTARTVWQQRVRDEDRYLKSPGRDSAVTRLEAGPNASPPRPARRPAEKRPGGV